MKPTHIALTSLLALASCSPETDQHHNRQGHQEAPHTEVHSEAEDEHVELTEKQFHAAGITLTSVSSGQVSESLTLPGAVASNTNAVLHVTPRVAGRVRSASKNLGDPVVTGELICVLDSVQLGEAVADYLRERELARAASGTLERERELFAGRLLTLTGVLEGAVEIQQRIYDREEELQKKSVSTMRALLEADKDLKLAQLEMDRQLTEIAAERDARLLDLEMGLRTKRIDLTAATNHLRVLGFTTSDLKELDEDSPLIAGEYRLFAPGNGIVVDRHASIGEYVEAGAKLYVIEDLSNVWFVASAFEEQLQDLRSGQSAFVSLDAFPGTTLSGTVSFIDYHVNPTSRTVGVRITLDNSQLEIWPEEFPLRPGMFGRVELETSARQADLVLPEQALIHEDSGDYVFVQVEAFAFERRRVNVKHVAGNMVEITSGLMPKEVVALTGTFLLKSVERQGELGGGHSH